MEFHLTRAVREKLDIDGLQFSYTGNLVLTNVAASRKLANRLNEAREAQGEQTPKQRIENTINAGALFAMGLIDELNHALVTRFRKEIDPLVLQDALRWFEKRIGPDSVQRLLLEFLSQFPPVDVFQGKATAAQWLAAKTEGLANREAAVEELMLLWLMNINPAFQSYRALFDDHNLQQRTPYSSVTNDLPTYLGTRPPLDTELGSLYDALSAPMLASPDSLTGQLDFIREKWPKLLGNDMPRILLAIDVLKEEELAVWMRFHPPGPERYRHGAPGFSGEGFVGDEFVGYNEFFGSEFILGPDGVRRRKYDKDYQAPLNEYEAFSADQAWMPNVVLMAKSTYVWLEQLSKKYGRHIYHLDHIPDEELRLMQERGITGLWLIGLWERSIASRTIKRLRGHSDAVASAYSLKEYNIAEDLGGGDAYANLRDRASRFGLRLASDMVPNHMGIDSPWVIEHPDWFISKSESPFPVYQFEGPDISPDSRAEIKIEDHYYDQTDAAVVFRLRHHASGETRYVYHGNDGTSFAWNDTAQLDYSKAYVREHVIQTILHVARQFPIIRFDAAMVLAKRHVQRLWFPLPGAGGSIPSRAENAISDEQFNEMMPHEFWREVVDRVAAEVPGTLLLAEAFWLLEGYFVRTLGMHRVYNSAFMNMLRDEENAKYRSYLKKTIEFDPDIMKRYVNFMSNPDERTAIDQFGSGDKFFGVATMLSTLPGLPMFAHGQIEGYSERYGMEFKQAKMEEWPNEELVARHYRDIAPLLKQRYIFAESDKFVLYDFWNEHGSVDENVFAYSNRFNEQRSLIFYNNAYASTRGSIHTSTASMDKGSGELRQSSLTAGMALSTDHTVTLAYRDQASGLEYLRRASDLDQHGVSLDLRGYQYVILLNWRELRSTAEQPWDRLCESLAGRGVPSVEEALLRLRFGSVHEALRQALDSASLSSFVEVAADTSTDPVVIDHEEVLDEGSAPELVSNVLLSPSSQETVSEAESKLDGPELLDSGVVLDPRLIDFVENSLAFFDHVVEILPEAFMTHNPKSEVKSDETESAIDSRVMYRQVLESRCAQAVRLPKLGLPFAKDVPHALRYPLPGFDIGSSQEQNWSPILAWIALDSFSGKTSLVSLFDLLQLRSALAESFASTGMSGEDTWRAAARVRVLILHGKNEVMANVKSSEFWEDPDVRWLTGVHDSEGKTYINKEQLEELIGWLALPSFLAIAAEEGSKTSSLQKLQEDIVGISKAVAIAGYELSKLTLAWLGKTSETPSRVDAEPIETLSR